MLCQVQFALKVRFLKQEMDLETMHVYKTGLNMKKDED